MKTLLKTTLTLAALFTPAAYVILPAVAICLATDLAGFVVRRAFRLAA
jgi:hypothetical protein